MTPDRFAAALRERFPDLTGESILVALSGGADSVALLLLLRDSHAGPLHAIHVHHHARGDDADDDAAFCAELCSSAGVPMELAHIDPVLRPAGSSPEAWWRAERYRLFEEARQRLGVAVVATAHTLDDQAETVLLKLLRGAGPRGAAGIRERIAHLIRPLLGARRADLREWLSRRGQAWREDPSNADPSRPRAWVRGELMPRLAARFPSAQEHLAAFAEALRHDEAWLAAALDERGHWPSPCRPVALAAVSALPLPLRRRWVLELAARLPLAEPPSRRQLAQVDALLEGRQPAAVDLGRRIVLRRRGSRLLLDPAPEEAFAPVPAEIPSRMSLPGGWRVSLGMPVEGDPRYRVSLGPQLRAATLAWRSPREGERFKAPIARLLAAAGVPAPWRRAWPLLEADGRIVWLPGVGVAPGWESAEGTGVCATLEEPWASFARSSRQTRSLGG
jgi:tRNA(Ile)-lysidine synthase